MSCPECVCGLVFIISEGGYRLSSVTSKGYKQEELGRHPIVPETGLDSFSSQATYVYRLNVHFPVDLDEGWGHSLFEIRKSAFEHGLSPMVCSQHSDTDYLESELLDFIRVRSDKAKQLLHSADEFWENLLRK
ncbi:hypothetical protein [Xenopus laevis endogenous retrovirus Xen1]|uniref:Uncharacterized protein n=1 Tax=Xenopus laevis endogenous retrovirus Xen1 TaxID=204873 RepID=Q8AEW1_9RETR|nr:hypothetical protein Xen1_gp2 [Xenopus laevis endogenous retrovirus Xen1]CAD44573.1 hypothetical protein [Xenopus laevis endogenous retrovirus Xen1]